MHVSNPFEQILFFPVLTLSKMILKLIFLAIVQYDNTMQYDNIV